MATNITAIYVSATATITDYPTRIRGVSWFNVSGDDAEIVIRDASAGGTVIFKAGLPDNGSSDVYLTDIGIAARNKVHVSVPASVFGTVFIG